VQALSKALRSSLRGPLRSEAASSYEVPASPFKEATHHRSLPIFNYSLHLQKKRATRAARGAGYTPGSWVSGWVSWVSWDICPSHRGSRAATPFESGAESVESVESL